MKRIASLLIALSFASIAVAAPVAPAAAISFYGWGDRIAAFFKGKVNFFEGAEKSL